MTTRVRPRSSAPRDRRWLHHLRLLRVRVRRLRPVRRRGRRAQRPRCGGDRPRGHLGRRPLDRAGHLRAVGGVGRADARRRHPVRRRARARPRARLADHPRLGPRRVRRVLGAADRVAVDPSVVAACQPGPRSGRPPGPGGRIGSPDDGRDPHVRGAPGGRDARGRPDRLGGLGPRRRLRGHVAR